MKMVPKVVFFETKIFLFLQLWQTYLISVPIEPNDEDVNVSLVNDMENMSIIDLSQLSDDDVIEIVDLTSPEKPSMKCYNHKKKLLQKFFEEKTNEIDENEGAVGFSANTHCLNGMFNPLSFVTNFHETSFNYYFNR